MVEISVVIPVFNGQEFISEALQSIKNQTVKPFEIVVVNDGSTDFSKEIALSFGARVIDNETNRGIGYSRKRGSVEAKGNYIAYLSCDDVYSPTFLESCIPLLKGNNATFTAYNRWIYDKDIFKAFKIPRVIDYGDFQKQCWEWALKKNMFVNFSTVIIPKKWFETFNFLPLRYGEDLIFLLDSLLNNFKWYYNHYTFINYRIHSEQMARKINEELFEMLWVALRYRLGKYGCDPITVHKAYLNSYKRSFPSLFDKVFSKLANFRKKVIST